MTSPATEEKPGPLLAVGRTAEVYAWGADKVVKLYRPETPGPAIEREMRVGQIVTAARLHAPRMYDAVEIEGRRGVLFDRVTGPSLLEVLMLQPREAAAVAEQFAAIHAEMHRVRHVSLPGLRASLAYSIGHAEVLTEDLRRALLAHLGTLPEGDVLCHGDFHPGNVIVSPDGPVVIDWMGAVAGNPDADVARTVFLLGMSALPPEFDPAMQAAIEQMRSGLLAGYLAAYRARRACSQVAIEAWLPVVAAARLTEGVLGEQDRLLALAGRVLA